MSRRSLYEAASELRWQNTLLPYQLWPCIRCGSHESWKEWSNPVGERQSREYLRPRSQWGCQCPTSAGGDWGWDLWMFISGRGTGKTLTGSHFALRQALEQPGKVGAVIAPTNGDLRRIVLEGPSGLLNIIPDELVDLTQNGNKWSQAAYSIKLKNGSVIRTIAAEKPDRIRGENFAWVWADELASWTRLDYAWEQLGMATRTGQPRFLVTTTPRPLPLLKALLEQEGTVTTRASSRDNPTLAAGFWRNVAKYEGTRIGRQELEGEILDDIEGALWTWDQIEDMRFPAPAQLERSVVGVDPSGGRDEIGIVGGAKAKDITYVLYDWTLQGSPLQWGQKAVELYHTMLADRIVGERNFGGDMVESTVRAADRTVSYQDVNASRGKRQRAEPVKALSEKGWLRLAGNFPELEHEMTSWVPDTGMASPNRLDAMVWMATELGLLEGGIPREWLTVSPGGITRNSPWKMAS